VLFRSAVMALHPTARYVLHNLDLMTSLANMSRSPTVQVRQAAAEVLANFVDTEGGQNSDHVLDKTTLGGLVELVHAGTVPGAKPAAVENACRAARALAQVAKTYEGKMRIAEMKGIGALLALAAADQLNARLQAVRVLSELSVVTKNQVEIASQGGLSVLLELTTPGATHDDEVEELALRTIANLAINADNKARLDRPEVKQRLNAIARSVPDPNGDLEMYTIKTKLAQRALNNMLSSRLLAKLSADASWFGGGVTGDDVRAILSLLQNSDNAAVGCEVARALGNIAEKSSNMPHIVAAGAVEAIADLVPSPDPQVQMLAARAVSLFALHDEARAMLTKQDVAKSLCRVLLTVVPQGLANANAAILEVATHPNAAPNATGATANTQLTPSPQRHEIPTLDHRDAILHASRGLANLCVMPELHKNAIVVVRENTIHTLVILVAHPAVDAEIRYEAARTLAALNQIPMP